MYTHQQGKEIDVLAEAATHARASATQAHEALHLCAQQADDVLLALKKWQHDGPKLISEVRRVHGLHSYK